jgi:hypothetical protein
MSIVNYSDLKTTIANYLGRSDLTAVIPDFIRLTEVRLARELRTRQMLKSATAPLTSGDPTLALPSDFIEMRDLFIQGNPRQPVSFLSPSAQSRDGRPDDIGKPLNYTIIGLEIKFAPKPDAVYTVEMLYYARPLYLSDTVTSNVFLSQYSDALLYGSLAQAEPYLMNDARIQTWAQLYLSAVDLINTSDQGAEYNGVPLQMKLTTQ